MPGTTTGRWALAYPLGADAANTIDTTVQSLAEKLRDEGAQFAQGLMSALPAAGKAGRWYYATDRGVVLYDNGSTWVVPNPYTDLMRAAMTHGVQAGANATAQLASGYAFTMPTAGNVLITAEVLLEETGATGATSFAVTGQARLDGGSYVGALEGAGGGSVSSGLDLFHETWSWLFTGLAAGAHTLDVRFAIGNSPVTVRHRGRGRVKAQIV